MTAYLVSVSIGPVQDFIAASRKTRDLWFGSMLLSEMSRAVALALRDTFKAELIFPYLSGAVPDGAEPQANESPVANKLLAILHSETPADDLSKLEEAAQKVLRDRFDEIETNRPLEKTSLIDWELARKQVGAFLEFYAAWTPYEGELEYDETREQVEHLLAGRKALRDFSPAIDGGAGVPKSSLDGSRESVLRPSEKSERGRPRMTDGQNLRLKIKSGEQLDGISLVKRHAEPNRFASVSRVAIDPLIRRLRGEPELAELVQIAIQLADTSLVESFKTGKSSGLGHYEDFPYDCQLFYGDGMADEKISVDDTTKSKSGLTSVQEQFAREFFKTVKGACRRLEIADPPAYLAVLVADGDRMGKAIGKIKTPCEHVAFSKRLSGFAFDADRIVQENKGALIYSGGDDVLAFLPVDRALKCADELRIAFDRVNEATTRPEDKVTLSVGVAIGHYHTHLDTLLQWGREAEGLAKSPKGGNRNALAVTLHTGSAGEGELKVFGQWPGDPVKKRWQTWVDWHRQDRFPDGAAFELRALSTEMNGFSAVEAEKTIMIDDKPTCLLKLEAERILKRKRGQRGVTELSASDIKSVLDAIGGSVVGLAGVADELIIARRIASITETALGPWKRPASPEEVEHDA